MKIILINLCITLGLLVAFKERVVQPMINHYDTYMHSASGWICLGNEPPDAHPEMKWNWKEMSYQTYIICHGEPVEFIGEVLSK